MDWKKVIITTALGAGSGTLAGLYIASIPRSSDVQWYYKRGIWMLIAGGALLGAAIGLGDK